MSIILKNLENRLAIIKETSKITTKDLDPVSIERSQVP